jgi:hypothetical protein
VPGFEGTPLSEDRRLCLEFQGAGASVASTFAIKQGSTEKMLIRGHVGSFVVPFLDGSRKGERMPAYGSGGYSDAFWALEYKPSAAFRRLPM